MELLQTVKKSNAATSFSTIHTPKKCARGVDLHLQIIARRAADTIHAQRSHANRFVASQTGSDNYQPTDQTQRHAENKDFKFSDISLCDRHVGRHSLDVHRHSPLQTIA
jgi:hypothetical protein